MENTKKYSPFFDFYHLTAIIDLPLVLFAEQIHKGIYLDLNNISPETTLEINNYVENLVDGAIIDIGASTFPGTYYAVGDTFARSRTTGKDEEFQLIIPKAKVMSENTITMEAEGDPSVFNMNLRVLRPADGKMVRLVKYKLSGTGSDPAADTTSIYHATDLKKADAASTETETGKK